MHDNTGVTNWIKNIMTNMIPLMLNLEHHFR